VLAALLAAAGLFVVGRSIQVYLSTRAALDRELATDAVADADRAVIALELPAWNIDRPLLDRVLESILTAPEVAAVVAEVAGRTHAVTRDAAWRPVPFDGKLDARGLLREDRAIAYGTERIGTVSVYVTRRFVEEKLRAAVLGIFVVATIVGACVVGSAWVVLRGTVIVPLRALERYAEAVSAGIRPDPSSVGPRLPKELAALRDATQRMVSLLDARYAQLAEAETSIRGLAARLQAVREEEKARIARDLHDDLGQLLTAVQMELRWIEERLVSPPDGEVADTLTDHTVEAARLTEQATRAVQRIAADLRPSALDQLGLGAALRQEGRRFEERTGIPCEVALDDDLPLLEGGAATALYRVAQEALTNVARHAQATRVAVALAAAGGELSLRVEDDGRGLAEVASGAASLGLLGMRERAAELGGDVTFSPGAGGGTRVELRIPLGRALAAEARRGG
jgi:signal transduction histidine kinase